MKKALLFAAMLIFIVALAGCWGNSDGDDSPPSVTGTSPTDGETRIDIGSVIAVTFSEPMNAASVEAAFSSIPALPTGTFTWAGTTLTFTPDAALDEATEYTVTVGTGAADVAGNPLSSANTFHFATRDITAPTVTGTSPADGSTGVELSTAISLTFSELMDQTSVQAAFSATPALPAGTFSWVGATMTFTLDAALDEATEYAVNVGTGAADVAGNPLSRANTFRFATRDITPPTVAGTSPTNGETGVDIEQAVSVTFSESMDAASVEAAFSSIPALPAGTFSWVGNTVTYTPDTSLHEVADYEVTIGAEAVDLAGNPLDSAFVFEWKTALPYKAITLESDFGIATSNGGVVPSADGQYFFWWDGTSGEGLDCNIHLYKVKISDLSTQTIWTNRSIWGIYDDGDHTWVGNYYPYEGSRIYNADPTDLTFRDLSLGHTIGLIGNHIDFPYVYFGTSVGMGVGYWDRDTHTTGRIAGSDAYIYQSAVIGDKVYFPRGHVSPPGILVVDAVANPTVLESTLLNNDVRLAGAGEILTDGLYLYVRNSTAEFHKIDPSGTGTILATFAPGVVLTNPALVGDYIYAGTMADKNVYILDKETGDLEIKDCSAYLPTAVGTPMWDFTNDGIWFGPPAAATVSRTAYFIPRRIIDDL